MQAEMVRVHVGVTREKQAELEAEGGGALARFAWALHLEEVDAGRLSAFGVVSGSTAPTNLAACRAAPGVEFVEVDGTQRALGR